MKDEKARTNQDWIEAAGLLFEKMGLARSRGIVWGLLYLAPKPLSLDDIARDLQISKGSASTATRALAELGAIRQVWVEGDRRDFFQAAEKQGAFVQNLYAKVFKGQFKAFAEAVAATRGRTRQQEKDGSLQPAEAAQRRARLSELDQIQRKLSKLRPLIEETLAGL